MRRLYTLILYLALPFILLRLWWKAKKLPTYQQRWRERLGFITPISENNCIWVHSVSVGETIAAIPLIHALQQQNPEQAIVITTMTPTGSELAGKQRKHNVYHFYIPYDLPNAINRFLKNIKPKLVIIMETELWPNILWQCSQQNIPILLANARLSARSARGYRFISKLMRQMFEQLSLIAAQTQEDAQRFISLGAKPEKIKIASSIKFDTKMPPDLIQQGKLLRASWDVERPVWIAASTHQGEEEKILTAFASVRKYLPTTLLILVPRHPKRCESVANLCKQRGYQFLRRSEGRPCLIDTDIFLGDTLGELFLYYAASDVAFVGGSLIPTGGHNILEPAALGLPVITGPNLFNFNEISRLLISADAMVIINNELELAEKVQELLENSELGKRIGENGREVVAQNRGALQQHLTWIEQLLQTSTVT